MHVKQNVWHVSDKAYMNIPKNVEFVSNDFTSLHVTSKQDSTTFTTFFKVGYYMGVIPFKPYFDDKSALWKVRHCRLQQVVLLNDLFPNLFLTWHISLQFVCFLLIWIPMWISHAYNMQVRLVDFIRATQLSAKKYFLLIRSVVNDVKLLTFFWTCTKRCSQLQDIFNYNREMENSLVSTESGRAQLKNSKRFLKCAVLIFYALNVTNFLYIHHDGQKMEANWLSMFHRLVQDGNQRWFGANPSNEQFVCSSKDLAVGIFEAVMRFANFQIYAVVELFFLVSLPMSFSLSMTNFEQSISQFHPAILQKERPLKNGEYPHTECLLDRFDELKGFVNAVNEVWSVLTLVWLVDHSMRLIFILNDSVITDDPINIATMITLVTLFVTSLFKSAEVYRKVTLNCLPILFVQYLGVPKIGTLCMFFF